MSYFSEVKVVDKVTGEAAQVDSLGRLKIIDSQSSRILEGKHFNLTGWLADQSVDDTQEFAITTPEEGQVLLSLRIWASQVAEVDIFEDCTDLVDGVPLTPLNSNRNSEETSVLTIVSNPTSITEGLEIGKYLTRNPLPIDTREIVLKADSIYLFKITTKEFGDISWNFGWYEL